MKKYYLIKTPIGYTHELRKKASELDIQLISYISTAPDNSYIDEMYANEESILMLLLSYEGRLVGSSNEKQLIDNKCDEKVHPWI